MELRNRLNSIQEDLWGVRDYTDGLLKRANGMLQRSNVYQADYSLDADVLKKAKQAVQSTKLSIRKGITLCLTRRELYESLEYLQKRCATAKQIQGRQLALKEKRKLEEYEELALGLVNQELIKMRIVISALQTVEKSNYDRH